MAYYDQSMKQLQHAQSLAQESGDLKQAVYINSMIGRVLVLTGETDAAAAILDHCIGQARRVWTALLPWPQSFRAEVDLLQGRIDRASEGFEQAFALGCQLADPCWEGIAGRGLGLVARARGEAGKATSIMLDTLGRCGRLPDAYVWGRAFVLDSLCDLAVARSDARAPAWVDQLMNVAARAGMRELVVRAHRYRADLGDVHAVKASRVLASEIDNGRLSRAIN